MKVSTTGFAATSGQRVQAARKLGPVGMGLAVITLSSAFLVPVVDGPWSSPRETDWNGSPRASFQDVTTVGRKAPARNDYQEKVASVERGTIVGLRTVSGLTADQLGRLFGVTRRSVQNWVAGGQMASFHEERLSHLYTVVLNAGASPEERRKKLLSSANGKSLFHQLLAELEQGPILEPPAVSARTALGV